MPLSNTACRSKFFKFMRSFCVPWIENPFNLQDFQDDKLSILDIRATDQRGAIYDIEMQLSSHSGLVKRIVCYGCVV